MGRRLWLTLVLAVAGTAVFAHVGVKDARVMAWMAGMKAMGGEAKIIARMARQQIPYDADAAGAALAGLATEAARIVPLFETRASDPKSEALPVIWSDFGGFAAKADALEAVIAGADVTSFDALQAAARDIDAACTACHRAYAE